MAHSSHSSHISHISPIFMSSKLALFVAALAFSSAWMIFWSIRMHIVMNFIAIGATALIWALAVQIQEEGLLQLLPASVAEGIRTYSIVDIAQKKILNPKISLDLFSLFMLELHPQERERVLLRLPPTLRHVLATKGIMKLLPPHWMQYMYPQSMRSNINSKDGCNSQSERCVQLANVASSSFTTLQESTESTIAVSDRNGVRIGTPAESDEELNEVRHDFLTALKRTVNGQASAFIESTLGEYIAFNVWKLLPSFEAMLSLGSAAAVSTTFMMFASPDVRRATDIARRGFALAAAFSTATFLLFMLFRLVLKRNSAPARRAVMSALLGGCSSSVILLVYLRNTRRIPKHPAIIAKILQQLIH